MLDETYLKAYENEITLILKVYINSHLISKNSFYELFKSIFCSQITHTSHKIWKNSFRYEF